MAYVPPHLRGKKETKERDPFTQLKEREANGRTVAVGLDQWVCIRRIRPTTLITSGLVGCVGLILESPIFLCVAHVSDGFEREWESYRHQLELPVAIMGAVTKATIVVSSRLGPMQQRIELLQKWLSTSRIHSRFEVMVAPGFFVSPNTDTSTCSIIPKNRHNLARFTSIKNLKASEATTAHLDHWGSLSDRAMDSGS